MWRNVVLAVVVLLVVGIFVPKFVIRDAVPPDADYSCVKGILERPMTMHWLTGWLGLSPDWVSSSFDWASLQYFLLRTMGTMQVIRAEPSVGEVRLYAPFGIYSGITMHSDCLRNPEPLLSLPDMEIEGWYPHRERNGNILFTRQETLPDLGPYVSAAGYGEFIRIYSLAIDSSPEEWVEYRQLETDLANKYGWDYINGRRHLQVVHPTPAADAQTDYFFGYGNVVIVSFYPYAKLQESSEERTKYTQFLYRVAALVDSAYSRDTLRANCAQEVPASSIDDTSADLENNLATLYWWDGAARENKNLTVAYEPDTDFAGCSASVRVVLERVRVVTQ